MGDIADELERRWAEIDRHYAAEKKKLYDEMWKEAGASLLCFAVATFAWVLFIAAVSRFWEWVM